MRFTIRDLLWLTVVVALGAAWWVDHRQGATKVEKVELENAVLRYRLELIGHERSHFYDE